MMKLSGCLTIRSIHGSKGAFNVGRLLTEIGEFAVKDPLIEEYEEGRYEGEFGITGIFPSTYFAYGRTVVEIRARLGSIALKGIEQLDPDQPMPSIEQDPMEDLAPPPQTERVDQAAPVPTSIDEVPGDTVVPSPDESSRIALSAEEESALRTEQEHQRLFGALWPLSTRVKLDPTVERQQFRAQRDALKAMGYEFQPLGQLWVKA